MFDDDFLTPLKDLSEHNYHGRIWVNSKDADKALVAVDVELTDRDGDICMWHDWLNATVYEINISGMNMPAIKRFLTGVKKATPAARMAVASKRGMIIHTDWRSYDGQ
jgi:hypothetical protein